MTDPRTTGCALGVGRTLDKAMNDVIAKFNERVKRDYADYCFSATAIEVKSFRSGLFGREFIVMAWFDRIPREV